MPDLKTGGMIEQLEKDIVSAKNNLLMDKAVLSIEEIMKLYKEDKIIVAPDFQVLFRWSNFQQTRFIESILLGFPVPLAYSRMLSVLPYPFSACRSDPR